MKLAPYVRLTRLEHGFLSVIGVLAGMIANDISHAQSIQWVLAVLVPLLTEAGLFALNDYFNIEEDKINAPNRPLVTGEIPERHALLLGLVSLSLAYIFSLAALLINKIDSVLLITLIILSGVLYDVKIKRLGFLGNLVVSFSTASTFLYGGLLVRRIYQINTATWIIFITAFTSCLGREILKGIRDYEGDKKAGVITLAVKYGLNTATHIAGALIVIAIAAALSNTLFVKNSLAYLSPRQPSPLK